jgi:hypothetical protein
MISCSIVWRNRPINLQEHFGLVPFTCHHYFFHAQASAQDTTVLEYQEADLRTVLDCNPTLGVAFYSAVCLQVASVCILFLFARLFPECLPCQAHLHIMTTRKNYQIHINVNDQA